VLGRFTVSQRKLNELWAPPELKFSTLYASTLRIVWLCLLYAPMYPPIYLLTALLLCFSCAATRCSVHFWYRRPPPIDEYLLEQTIALVGFGMPLHVLVMYRVQTHAQRNDSLSELSSEHWERLVIGLIASLVWMIYWLSTQSQIAWLMLARLNIALPPGLDTQGIQYSKVPEVCGYDIDRYECPAASKLRSLESLKKRVLESFTMGASSVDRFGEGSWKMRHLEHHRQGSWSTIAKARRVGQTGKVRPILVDSPPSSELPQGSPRAAPAPADTPEEPNVPKPEELRSQYGRMLPAPGKCASVSCRRIVVNAPPLDS